MGSAKKSRKISVKLTEQEYLKLEKNAEMAGMKLGPYVRKCIESSTIMVTPKAGELASLLSRLHIELADRGFCEDESIMQEMRGLWRILL